MELIIGFYPQIITKKRCDLNQFYRLKVVASNAGLNTMLVVNFTFRLSTLL